MSTALQQSIETLYEVFASVPKPATIEGCPCCLKDKEIHVLLSKPLRELSPEELSRYASSVFLTVGDVTDFRYYLPRILDVLTSAPGWWPDPEIVGSALQNANWSTWPDAEQNAISTVFDAKIDANIEEPDGYRLDSWLCGIARSGASISTYLDKVATSDTAVLALYGWMAKDVSRGNLAKNFWKDVPDAAQEMLDWFHSPKVGSILFQAYGVLLKHS